MVSLVVCSINPKFLKNLQENVSLTIGVEHEWLIWDNRKDNKGLCEVYNNLAKNARFPYVCFLHEDLLFRSENWGSYLVKLMESDPAIALVGIAGGKYKSRLYSGWYSGANNLDYYNVTHRECGEALKILSPQDWRRNEEPVVCIDGIFMFCAKNIWEKYSFDETLLKGFHFYDIDFSLLIAESNKVVVTNKVDVVHLTTGGDYGNKWVEQAFLYHDFRNNHLPSSVVSVDKEKIELSVAKYWLDWLKNQPISFSNRLKWIKKQKPLWNMSLAYSITKFLFYKPLGLRGIHQYFLKKNK